MNNRIEELESAIKEFLLEQRKRGVMTDWDPYTILQEVLVNKEINE